MKYKVQFFNTLNIFLCLQEQKYSFMILYEIVSFNLIHLLFIVIFLTINVKVTIFEIRIFE